MLKILYFFLAAISWFLAFCAEVIFCYIIVTPQNSFGLSIGILFLLHFAATGLSTLSFKLYDIVFPNKHYQLYIYFNSLITFFFPLIGIIGCLLTCILTKFLKKGGIVDEHARLDRYIDQRSDRPEMVTDFTAFVNAETEIEPIIDIINGKDVELKRGAVNLLSRIGSPDAIKLLKNCLSDDNDEVRFYASTAIARLNDQHTFKIKKLKKLSDKTFDIPASLIKYGEACKQYSETGLIEENAGMFYISMAKDSFVKALKLEKENIELKIALGHLCICKKEYDEASIYFKETLKAKPDSHDAFLGLCQLYFEMWDLKSLSEFIKTETKPDLSGINDTYKQTLVEFWSNEKEDLISEK